MSRIIGDLLQAVGRGAVRQMTPEGDVPDGCTLDVIASCVGPMGFSNPVHTLATMFPGAKVHRWYPKVPTLKPNMERTFAGAAQSLLGHRNEAFVTSGEWAKKAGYSARTLQRAMNKTGINGVLAHDGLTVGKQGQKWLIRRTGETKDLGRSAKKSDNSYSSY
jgi:hypothetical protein